MNINLLNKVANAILDEPAKFKMDWWTQPDSKSPCGTSACIAGFAVALNRNIKTMSRLRKLSSDISYDGIEIDTEASRLLGLQYIRGETSRLFNYHNWPSRFSNAYQCALTKEDRADIAFWRIQHFIATDGKQ